MVPLRDLCGPSKVHLRSQRDLRKKRSKNSSCSTTAHCSPLASGYLPSELLNNRQIRAKIDTLLPSPAHIAQERQAQEATKSQAKELEDSVVNNIHKLYSVGTPCYALYCGPRCTSDPKWVPATVVKVHGLRSVNVKVHPRRCIWQCHLEQLRPRYRLDEDLEPGQDVQDHIRTQNTVE